MIRRVFTVIVCLLVAGIAFAGGMSEGQEGTDAPAAGSDRESAAGPSAFDERVDERERLVERRIVAQGITDQTVVDAMRSVPRHVFVPPEHRDAAYADRPLPIGHGQTISQPYVVAYMTEVLEVGPSSRVLEVGTGSGYQAAVLAEVVETVHTIEVIEPLARSARARLESLDYDAVVVHAGDGYYGWEEAAPYDAIIVTAAAGHVPPPLLEQLKPDGRMVIPVGPVHAVQQLILVEKAADGSITTTQLVPVRFVPMTGRAQE
ncbi:MAG: protein-L-isoaspartate(D-aspartate) O-methyltransferase [Spirochaetota bacterium]